MCIAVQSELDSFLIQISAEILAFKDPNGSGFLVDRILDKTGMKGTGGPYDATHSNSSLAVIKP